ncbi:hypothetical protein CEP52_013205 [Fusarium oligoseptatum]|uniref:Protein kinase domain-containing protein n=1 Tax=Fusarium oligoseptatum TaxID=2604345 RepID=A0A428SUS8_9HYPO|nr:hypothetical protein CEP52_013205 [Fusarium oligoseptatum]
MRSSHDNPGPAGDALLEVPAQQHSQSSTDNDGQPVSRRSTASSTSDLEPLTDSDYEYDFPPTGVIIHIEGTPLNNQPEIQESDSELRDISRPPSPNLYGKRTNNDIALASIRGKGLPTLSPDQQPVLPTDHSEVSDLGDGLDDTKLEERLCEWQKDRHPEAALHDLLLAEYRKPQAGSKGFIPRGHIWRVLQERDVRQEIVESLSGPSGPSQAILAKADEYTRLICNPSPHRRSRHGNNSKPESYLKIFAILVLIERVSSIGDFIKEGVDDSALPLRRVEVKSTRVPKFELRPRPQDSSRLACFKRWNQVQLMQFDDWQWTVMAPFFSRAVDGKVMRYRFPDSTILPFSKEKRQPGDPFEEQEFEGGFGKVSKVYIHPEHHNFYDGKSNDSAFAIKKLKSRSLEKYKSEFNMLATFSKTEDPHLVPLRAAYRLRNACYFIFDWADTDLSRYWTFTEPRPPFNKDTVIWVAKQCYGLANGLQTIHRYGSIEQSTYQSSATDAYETVPGRKLYGRHGDIKPQNILLFKDPEDPDGRGILRICDFGQAELHSAHSRSNRPNTDVAISLFYRPPECDIKGGTISRSYDIWTIGCLYLEFVAWMLGGWSLVTIFARQRAGPDIPWAPQLREHLFFDRLDEGRSAQVKPCVGDFIKWLRSHAKCTDFIHEFLDVIENELLVVETPGADGLKRLSCGPLATKLHKFHQKCLRVPGYADEPNPTRPA